MAQVSVLFLHGYKIRISAPDPIAASLRDYLDLKHRTYFKPSPGVIYEPIPFEVRTRPDLTDEIIRRTEGLVPIGRRKIYQVMSHEGHGDYFTSPTRSTLVSPERFVVSMDTEQRRITLTLLDGAPGPEEKSSIASPSTYFQWTLAEWFSMNGLFPIHACGASKPSGDTQIGFLVLGESGVGKSTMSIALTKHGWQFMGDEIILLDSRVNPPVMRSFVGEVKVDARSIELHPELKPLLQTADAHVDRLVPDELQEYIFHMADWFETAFPAVAEIVGLVHLRNTSPEDASREFRPLSGTQALKVLLEAGEHQRFRQREARLFSCMGRVAESCRAWWGYTTPSSLEDIPRLADELLLDGDHE